MRRGDHLREIDDSDLFIFIDHEIELVEITVDQAVLGEANDHLNELVVYLLCVNQASNVDHRISLDKTHHDTVPVSINGDRCREITLMQRLHESVLFEGRNTRHVEPALRCPILKVVAVVFDCAERGSTKSGELDNNRLTVVDQFSILILLIAALTNVDIRLFAHTDLAHNLLDVASLHEHPQRQVIVAHVRQRVSTVVLACVEHALMLE